MAQKYPVVRLQREKEPKDRIKGPPVKIFPRKRTFEEQSTKHSATFDSIEESTKNFQLGIDVSNDPRAVTPDRALVIELYGRVADFERLAQGLGFEWLTSEENDVDDEEDADEQPTLGGGRLYLTMPTVSGLETLLSRWKAFKAGKPASNKDENVWWTLFSLLKDVRTWSAQDRIDPSIAKYVELILSGAPDAPVVMEIDLWYRNEKQRRDKAYDTLKELLLEVGGDELDFVSIPEINYEAALVRIPAGVARKLARREGKLATADEIMTIRPQSLFHASGDEDLSPTMPAMDKWTPQPGSQNAVAAILDGYPIGAHSALGTRIAIHEVDVSGANVPVSARNHGTAMASLVVHGDLHAPQPPLDKVVAVVPVLTSNTSNTGETTPPGKLPIGMVYRAVKFLVEGLNDEDAAAPDVVLINHSICDEYAPFVRRPTPWAVLLDHLSHKHRLLFVVSAGNIDGSFPIPLFPNKQAFDAETAEAREAAMLLAIEQAKGQRGILSPAESINAITVGAIHGDGGGTLPATVVDPYPSGVAMTNLCSAVGFGVRRGIKPDLVEYGGRQTVIVSQEPNNIAVRAYHSVHMGQMVAAPDPTGANLSKVALTSGTSNAAALVTRAGIVTAQAVDAIFAADGIDWLKLPTRAVILKALVAHGARWGVVGNLLEEIYPPKGQHLHHPRRETIAKFLGYGRPHPDLVISGDQSRITLLGYDTILHDKRHEYRVPIPSAMLGTNEIRRIIITLAWSSPVSVTSDMYRGVGLKVVDKQGKKDFWKGVSRVLQPNSKSTERGTLIHYILEGKNKVKELVDRNGILIGVQAFANRPAFAAAQVPYALAITLEMAQSQRSASLYAEVQNALIQQRTQTATRAGVKV